MERTDLMWAVIDQERDRVRTLLDSGVDPDVVDKNGWSALHFAAQGGDPSLVEPLLGANAKVDCRNIDGNSPLFVAVFNYEDDGDCVSPLLAAGADPDAMNEHGMSPRTLAAQIANYDVRRFFESR